MQTSTSSNHSTILIVDDDPLVCDTLERYLSLEGHGVISTQDGSETLELVEKQGIDLVMLDVRMPGQDGLAVLSHLRRHYPSDQLPILMMTGFGDHQGALQAFDLGADDYVTKPIDFPVVAARIQTRLRLRLDQASEPLPDHQVGEVLGDRYLLEGVIGQGQFGVVYRARRLADGLPLAVKLLRTEVDSSPETTVRFHREVETLRRLQHPHAVTVLEFVQAPENRSFLVMELLEGHSLHEELRAVHRFETRRCVEIIRPVCEVLAEAHEKGIVHRDIKPQNIFLHREDGQEMVKVLDFGIAKLLDGPSGSELTREGIGPGTPAYMAPERYYELPCDGAADIYSLGVTLHEMLTGHLPFANETASPLRVALKHMSEAPPSIRSSDPSFSPILEDLVLRMMSKDPHRRPTAREVNRALSETVGPFDSLPSDPAEIGDGNPPPVRSSLLGSLGHFFRRR